MLEKFLTPIMIKLFLLPDLLHNTLRSECKRSEGSQQSRLAQKETWVQEMTHQVMHAENLMAIMDEPEKHNGVKIV